MNHVTGNDVVQSDYAQKLIRFKARQLCRRRDFRGDEPADIQQELWLAILKVAGQFDSTKASLNTFIDRVIDTAAAMLVRVRQRREEVWDGVEFESLDEPSVAGSDQPEPKWERITQSDVCRRLGTEPVDEIRQRDDGEAVAKTLSAMPKSQRRFCRKLMSRSVKSLSIELGVSRRQVRKQIAETRPAFVQFGLG
jgi:RNA polymerase sigma factor (sigma-70 family)